MASELVPSPLHDKHAEIIRNLQKPLLGWLCGQKQLGLVTDAHIAEWKSFFGAIPAAAEASFPASFPSFESKLSTAVCIYVYARILCLCIMLLYV